MGHKNISDMEDLANNGWSKMSNILDKEMPIKKKNNRVLFWWIGSAAAATLALIIGFSLNGNNSAKTISQTIPEISIPTITSKKESNNKNKETSISTRETPISTSPKTQKHLDNYRDDPLTQGTSISNTLLNKTGSAFSNISSKSNTLPLQEILIDLDKYKITALANQSTKPNTPDKYIKETISISPLSAAGLISKLSKETKLKNIPSTIITTKSKFNYGIQILYGSGSPKGYSEIGIGMTGLRRIKNKWSLITSLNIHQRNRLFNNKSVNEFAADVSDPNNLSLAGRAIVPSGRTLESANTIKLNQLTFQLGLQYQFKPRLAINGSLLPSYTIINNEKYNTWYSDPIDPSINFALDGITSPRTWNVHADLGLSYLLTSQIIMGLNYSYLTTRKGQDMLSDPNFESDEWRFSVQYLLD